MSTLDRRDFLKTSVAAAAAASVGLSAREAAEVLDVTPRTVERDWRFARTWLYDRLSQGEAS